MSALLNSNTAHSTVTNENQSNDFDRSIAAELRQLGPFIHPPCPNPAPLGLFAFGLTTALLQVKHTGLSGDNEGDNKGTENLVWGFAIFFGGLLQVIAGLVEVKRNNIFGFTAFTTYGCFWLSLATANVLVDEATADVLFSVNAVQAMFSLMGIFTFVMWLCTFKLNVTISVLFFLLTLTFFLLAGGVEDATVDKAAGWMGMATAATAYWLGAAELINDVVGEGRTIIPLGSFPSNRYTFGGATRVPGRTQSEDSK